MQPKIFLFSVTASFASAAIFGNSDFSGITAGRPFEITWIDASGPVVINLKNGPSTALNDVATIGSGLTGTSFSWTPSASLSDGPYALEIVDTSGINYSVQFPISGSTSASGTSAATRPATPSLSATVSASQRTSGSASVTASSSPDETETTSAATLSTANPQSRNSTMTGSSASTSTGTRSTRTASSSTSTPTSFNSDSSAAKDSSFVIATVSTFSGLMMLVAAIF